MAVSGTSDTTSIACSSETSVHLRGGARSSLFSPGRPHHQASLVRRYPGYGMMIRPCVGGRGETCFLHAVFSHLHESISQHPPPSPPIRLAVKRSSRTCFSAAVTWQWGYNRASAATGTTAAVAEAQRTSRATTKTETMIPARRCKSQRDTLHSEELPHRRIKNRLHQEQRQLLPRHVVSP